MAVKKTTRIVELALLRIFQFWLEIKLFQYKLGVEKKLRKKNRFLEFTLLLFFLEIKELWNKQEKNGFPGEFILQIT